MAAQATMAFSPDPWERPSPGVTVRSGLPDLGSSGRIFAPSDLLLTAALAHRAVAC